jgi:hypothetical protein
MSKRNEMEDLFLQCVDEVRRDIVKRRGVTLAKNGGKLDPDVNLKIKTSHFTGTDKKNVIDLLLSNENVLLFIYDKLFPRTSKTYSARATFQPKKFEVD